MQKIFYDMQKSRIATVGLEINWIIEDRVHNYSQSFNMTGKAAEGKKC
jgi:hypothetical protein